MTRPPEPPVTFKRPVSDHPAPDAAEALARMTAADYPAQHHKCSLRETRGGSERGEDRCNETKPKGM